LAPRPLLLNDLQVARSTTVRAGYIPGALPLGTWYDAHPHRGAIDNPSNGSRLTCTEGSMQVQSPQPTADHPRHQTGRTGDHADTTKGPTPHRMPTLQRRVMNLSKRGLRRLFEYAQRLGVGMLPRHFYPE